MPHLDEGTIHSWLDGDLPDGERLRVERHVAECPQCAAMVAEARGMIAGAARIVSALDSVPGGVIPKAPVAAKSRSLWRTLGVTPARAAVAATLLIAVAATLAKRHERPGSIAPNGAEQTVKASVPAAAPAAGTVALVAPAAVGGVQHAVARAAGKVAETHERRRALAIAYEPAVIAPPPAAVAVAAEAKRIVGQPTADSARPIDSTMNRATLGGTRRLELRSAAATSQLNEVVTTGVAQPGVAQAGFPGCYRVTSDSLVRAGIPQRFALQTAGPEKSPAQNIVRLVTPDGRIDSVLAGSTWRELSPRVANVSFAVGQVRTLRLEFTTAGGIAGQAEDARQSVGIVRWSCQP